MAKTLTPSSTSAAATSSCVESGFEAQRVRSAPPAWRVCMRWAVSLVTCRHAETRSPFKGFDLAKRSAMVLRTGMERADHSMRPWPFGASFGSFTSCGRFILATAIEDPRIWKGQVSAGAGDGALQPSGGAKRLGTVGALPGELGLATAEVAV